MSKPKYPKDVKWSEPYYLQNSARTPVGVIFEFMDGKWGWMSRDDIPGRPQRSETHLSTYRQAVAMLEQYMQTGKVKK